MHVRYLSGNANRMLDMNVRRVIQVGDVNEGVFSLLAVFATLNLTELTGEQVETENPKGLQSYSMRKMRK